MRIKTVVSLMALVMLQACRMSSDNPDDKVASSAASSESVTTSPLSSALVYEIGSAAWFEWVAAQTGLPESKRGTESEHGSDEWCMAVQRKLFGPELGADAPCSPEWNQQVDAALRQK